MERELALVHHHRLIAIFLAFCFLTGSCFDISTYPLVSPDEAILSDPARWLAQTGELRSDVLKANPGFENHYLLHPPGLVVATAISYAAFDFGIWQTRLPSIIFGALGIALAFFFVRDITQRTLPAVLAAASICAWPDWVLTAKSARMDTGAICFLLLASILVHKSLWAQKNFQLGSLFLAGLCASVASIFHTASFTWVLALLVAIFVFSEYRLAASAVYCVGASLVIGAWLTYALFHFGAFENQYLWILAHRMASGGAVNRIILEVERYAGELRRVATIALPAGVALIGFARTHCWRDRSIQFLLVLAGVLLLANGLVAGKPGGFFTLYPMVLVLSLVAIGVAKCVEIQDGGFDRQMPVIAALSFALFLANSFAVSYGPRLLAFAFQGPERDYASEFKPLSMVLNPNDQVWGSGVAWYAVVEAGARLDSQPDSNPLLWDTHPDPTRHRYVVADAGSPPQGFDGFTKVQTFGDRLPRVLGSPLSDRSYFFELWISQRLKSKPP